MKHERYESAKHLATIANRHVEKVLSQGFPVEYCILPLAHEARGLFQPGGLICLMSRGTFCLDCHICLCLLPRSSELIERCLCILFHELMKIVRRLRGHAGF